MRKQSNRAIILIFYIGILFVMNYLAFGNWLPDKDSRGLWFYAGISSVLLGNLLVTPFFTKPVDAISYSVVSLIAIFLVNDWVNWTYTDRVIFIISVTTLLFVLSVSFIGILLKDSNVHFKQNLSKTSFIISDFFGNPKVVFSVVILFALIVFHRNNEKELLFITLAWIVTVVIEPDKHLFSIINRIRNIWRIKNSAEMVGRINSYQHPQIFLIQQPEKTYTNFGTPVIFKDSHNVIKTGLTLNYIGQDEQLLLRAIEFRLPEEIIENSQESIRLQNPNTVININYSGAIHSMGEYIKSNKEIENLIGIVDEHTTIERLKFEVLRNDEIEEGCLVEVEINNKPVIYQILDGLTKEDIVFQKNKYGYVRADATKIGIWDKDELRFKPSNWLPQINSPVFLKKSDSYTPNVNTIGHFPNSNYYVDILNINDLVTHNTAILGILGIGKSMLSLELVERMIAHKIKVICIDLTDQYEIELADFYDKPWNERCIKEIQDAGKTESTSFNDSPEKGGSINNLGNAIERDLYNFIHSDEIHYLKIYNPSQFYATKQLTDPKSFRVGSDWQRSAALWDVTPVEITSIITERTLTLLQGKTTSSARVCLVFEEAHSLIPEWSSAVSESDKSATNRTSRAILQGRKFGLGCLLITQRTANVTKTILNQCNTIFAMRTFDDTGKSFIANYIGSEYAEKLSTLQARQAVFYGKASSCNNPVLLRLNDRDKFIAIFRDKYPTPSLT